MAACLAERALLLLAALGKGAPPDFKEQLLLGEAFALAPALAAMEEFGPAAAVQAAGCVALAGLVKVGY